MSEYSLVIRNGTVVDGTGLPGYRADVGVEGDRITAIGRIAERGDIEVDAEGHVVTPGFIDGHTHFDAQVFWDPQGSSSCWHGVTTVVMGNCGFTLAPSRPGQPELVIENLERAEDIPAEALAEGVTFSWERFAEYLDVLDGLPKGINYAVNVGHSALRSWAMGERAFEEEASDDDLRLMADELRAAMAAGAVGFTSSRSDHHKRPDGRPVASRVASWEELTSLVSVLSSTGGIFEVANETEMRSEDPAARAESRGRLRQLALDTGVPTTFGVTAFGDPNRWREMLDLIDDVGAAGGRMIGQSSCQESGAVFSFKTWLPFDRLPEWSDLRALSLDKQAEALRQPDVRRRLVEAAHQGTYAAGSPLKADYERLCVVEQTLHPNPSLAGIARERGVDPVEAMIDLALESDFDRFFFQITGNEDLDEVQAILQHPRTVMTFTDSGAHVSQIIHSSMQSHLLGYWVREREVLTIEDAVRMITLVPATIWGFADRGLIREGFAADLNVIDPATVEPDMPTVEHDLPAGAKRLKQTATGFRATVVAGEVVLRDGEAAGPLPGRLLRRGGRTAA